MELEKEVMPGPAATLIRLWKKTQKDTRWLVVTVTIFKDLRTQYNFHGDADEPVVEQCVSIIKKFRQGMSAKKPTLQNKLKGVKSGQKRRARRK